MTRDAAFMQRLRRLVRQDDRPLEAPALDAAPSISSFVARQRERIAETRFERAALVLVIEGAKELVQGTRTLRIDAGEALALAGGWRGTVVNEPDEASGLYRALYVDFPPELILRAHRAHPDRSLEREASVARTGRVTLTTPLVAAVLHLCEGLRDGSLPPHLVTHRATEVLLVLADQGALPLAPGRRNDATADAMRALIRWQPERRWTAAEFAREMGASPATLRRRLAAEGTSLRTLLAAERMQHAQAIMTTEGSSVAEAAEASGYASRSRFSRRYKAVHGAPPSADRLASERIGHHGEHKGHR